MIKNTIIKVLSGLAIALGTAAFILWKLFMHEKNRRDAQLFVQNTPHAERDAVLRAFEAERDTLDETVDALRDEVEKETKREVIDGFKKAFGVRPDVDDDDELDARLRGDK